MHAAVRPLPFLKTLLFTLGATIIVAPATIRAAQSSAPAAPSQTAAKPSFDVASIIERNPQSSDNIIVGMSITKGRLTDQCATLKSSLYFAFNLTDISPLEGLPDWADASCGRGTNHANTYQIEATMPPDTTDAQVRQMMQSLLADRFKLAFHWEKKEMPVYDLVVGKGGFKAKPVPPDAPPVYGSSLWPCPTEDPRCNMFPGAPGTISGLADILGPFVGRPVIDKTGIQGNYDRMLKWAGTASIGSMLPSLPSLLQEKYGLELKSDKAPVDVLVIDHAEKPTPN